MGDHETECLCGLEIDGELIMRRLLLGRQLARWQSTENLGQMMGEALAQFSPIWAVAEQTADLRHLHPFADQRYAGFQ